MNNLNSVLIEGVILEAPLFRQTGTGRMVTTFKIESKRVVDGEEEVFRIPAAAWGKLAENVYRNAGKGRGVRVVGWLKEDCWQGVDGKSRSYVSVVAEHVEFRPEFGEVKTSTRKRKAGNNG